jgi:hypothetical protein
LRIAGCCTLFGAAFADPGAVSVDEPQPLLNMLKPRTAATIEPKPYQRRPLRSVADPFKPLIDAILQADEEAPPKQRHTAAKIFRRLQAEYDYPGCYDRVRRYIAGRQRQQRETFIPLETRPNRYGSVAIQVKGQ